MNQTYYYETSGYSMWPFLLPKERLLVKEGAFAFLRRGDLLLYRAGDQVICHRVVGIDRIAHTVFVRGDAAAGKPEVVCLAAIVGRAVGKVRKGRLIRLDTRMQYWQNQLIICVLPAVRAANRVYHIVMKKNRA